MSNASNILERPVPLLTGLASFEGMTFVAVTTVYNHRELEHQSIELDPIPQHVARTIMWMLGVQPRFWAGVHGVHHSVTDANLLPVKETADYLEWRKVRSAHDHPEIPRLMAGMDPGAILRPDQVLHIGSLTDKIIGGRYDRPTDYSAEEGARLLDPKRVRYLYKPNGEQKTAGLFDWEHPSLSERSLERLAPEIRDPHSPILHALGVLGILRENVPRYKEVAYYMKQQEAAGRDFGRDVWDERIYDRVGMGIGLFYAGNIGVQAAVEYLSPGKKDSQSDRVVRAVLKGAAKGTLVSLGADGILIAGGNATNGFGHGGDFSSMYKLLLQNEITMNQDGSYTTDDKRLSLPSLDEVGDQDYHHKHPDEIDYTAASGLRGMQDAPFGKSIKFLVDHRIGMKPGKQYGARDAAPGTVLFRRPDIRSEAVLAMEKARVETRDQNIKLAA